MKKILIVDDEKVFTQAMARLFTQKNFQVTVASNGFEAVDALKEVEPDIIISDILMPNSDGIELLLYIKKNKIKTPVIAISGGGRLSSIDYLKMAERFGAAATLNKPVSFDELLFTVKQILQEESLQNPLTLDQKTS